MSVDDEGVVRRIRALVERAAHPDTPEEEARTSAVVACKLIVEKKIVLGVEGRISSDARREPFPSEWGDPSTWPTEPTEPHHADPEWPRTREDLDPFSELRRQADRAFHPAIARYRTACGVCGRIIDRGQRMERSAALGVRHVGCS